MLRQQSGTKRAFCTSLLALIVCVTPTATQSEVLIQADRIEQALTALPGDATRGRAILTNRQVGLCLLCHTGQFKEELTPGNVAPSFEGIGARYSTAQLRLRVAMIRKLNPQSIMPNMHDAIGSNSDSSNVDQRRIADKFKNQPILTAQQVEDVVAFLKTLQ
jgi:L-cysteine S-thiosulfotransferase